MKSCLNNSAKLSIMKKSFLLVALLLSAFFVIAQHNAGNMGKVLMIVSNPTISKQTGWPIGVWYSEVTHPYWEFTEAGYTVEFASPDGGEIKFDAFSDPEDESQYAAFDIISLGFKNDPSKMDKMKNTLKLSEVDPYNYKAIFVCGGQGPMYTFYNNKELHQFFVDFYETGKPTAAICHGTCILLKTKLSNGNLLVQDKTWTGFANSEEQYSDDYVGFKIQPFRIEDEAHKLPKTNFITGKHPFDSHAVKDGNLITGQQQNSGAEAARLVIQALEEDRKRYPTYVLVHGAFADESAWGFVRNQLAEKANVLVVNLPGHGIELTPADQVSMADYVKTVERAIESVDGKVILVGHSMAGMVISQVAENMPGKIDQLVYVSAYLPKNGDDMLALANQDNASKVGRNFIVNETNTSATLKREAIVPAVCADCPEFMKEALVKYHKPEPTSPMMEQVVLTEKRFAAVPKYYIHTTEDFAVSYELQKKMVENNGTIVKTFTMETSHLPFVVQPQQFLEILTSLK